MSVASFSAAASAAVSVSSMALGVAVTWLARPPRSEMLTALVSHAYASAFDLLMLEALPGRLGRVHLAVVGEAAEAGCRALVEQHRDVRVQLQRRCRAGRGDRPLHGGRHRARLGFPGDDEQQVTRLEDGPDALGEHVGRHLIGRVEEPGVVLARLRGEGLDPGAAGQRRPRLVEGEVAVGADAEELQVDTPGGRDQGLVALPRRRQSAGTGVGAVDVVGADVQAVSQLAGYRRPVAL